MFEKIFELARKLVCSIVIHNSRNSIYLYRITFHWSSKNTYQILEESGNKKIPSYNKYTE